MKRFLITTFIIAAGSLTMATESLADHTLVRRDFEIRRVSLEQDYKERRAATRYAYHRERDAIRAERNRALRIDCRDTRALRVRALNNELSALSRDFNLRNRSLTTWFHNERDALRTSYEIALRSARNPVVVTRPVNVTRPFVVGRRAHPADCECNVCHPPVVETRRCETEVLVPGFGTTGRDFGRAYRSERGRDLDYGRSGRNYDRGGYSRGYDNGYSPASYGRSSSNVNWAGLIMSLIN